MPEIDNTNIARSMIMNEVNNMLLDIFMLFYLDDGLLLTDDITFLTWLLSHNLRIIV